MPEPGRDRWLIGEWATAFARSIEDMTSQRTTFEVAGFDRTAERSTELLWRRQGLDLHPGASLFIGASPEVRSGIGGLILKSAGVDDADADTIDGTFLEILGQALGTLVRVVSGSLGRDVKSTDADAGPPDASLPTFRTTIHIGENPALDVLVCVSPELIELLETAAAAAVEPPRAKAATGTGGTGNAPEKPRQFDLLLDVELPVSVSFGRAQLALKDVIKLTTGSIIELNRSVSEPVDVIVNNCVIARGEVVVIEGNFGVRIQQVISRQERLRTLR